MTADQSTAPLETPMPETKSILTNAEWRAEGVRLFGTEDVMQWKFCCVSCGTASSPADFDKLGANPRRAQNECIGRIHVELGGLPNLHIDGDSKPCNWAAGGLFRLSTVIEVESPHGGTGLAFPFADPTPAPLPLGGKA